MSELLSKISSYNVLNFLLSGVVFAALAGSIVEPPIVQRNAFTDAFLFYFLGLAVSRFGSLVIEPLLRSTSFVEFANYKDFVSASRRDPKIEVLSEINNVYRTMASVFSLLLLLKLYVRLERLLPLLKAWDTTILAAVLLLLFLFSYRKQTTYIAQRIKANG
jgi:hypothetical protein